ADSQDRFAILEGFFQQERIFLIAAGVRRMRFRMSLSLVLLGINIRTTAREQDSITFAEKLLSLVEFAFKWDAHRFSPCLFHRSFIVWQGALSILGIGVGHRYSNSRLPSGFQ